MVKNARIKVLGTGCQKCHKLVKVVVDALKGLDSKEEVLLISNFKEIASYGVLTTPALVIDEKVVFSGRIPQREELEMILKNSRKGE